MKIRFALAPVPLVPGLVVFLFAGMTFAANRGWVVFPSPNSGQTNYLTGVTAVSSSDAWTVGYAYDSSSNQINIVQHWNGMRWSAVESPVVGYATTLLGVTANSSKDITAVGYIQTRDVKYLPITEHWNGIKWAVVPPPNPGRVAQLYGAKGLGRSTWAVGAYSSSPMTQGYMVSPATLIMRNH